MFQGLQTYSLKDNKNDPIAHIGSSNPVIEIVKKRNASTLGEYFIMETLFQIVAIVMNGYFPASRGFTGSGDNLDMKRVIHGNLRKLNTSIQEQYQYLKKKRAYNQDRCGRATEKFFICFQNPI